MRNLVGTKRDKQGAEGSDSEPARQCSKAIRRAERLPEVKRFVTKFQRLYRVGEEYTWLTTEIVHYGVHASNEIIERLEVEFLRNGEYGISQDSSDLGHKPQREMRLFANGLWYQSSQKKDRSNMGAYKPTKEKDEDMDEEVEGQRAKT